MCRSLWSYFPKSFLSTKVKKVSGNKVGFAGWAYTYLYWKAFSYFPFLYTFQETRNWSLICFLKLSFIIRLWVEVRLDSRCYMMKGMEDEHQSKKGNFWLWLIRMMWKKCLYQICRMKAPSGIAEVCVVTRTIQHRVLSKQKVFTFVSNIFTRSTGTLRLRWRLDYKKYR